MEVEELQWLLWKIYYGYYILGNCGRSWEMNIWNIKLENKGESCQPARLLCPWKSSGNNNGVGCHFFLQGILPAQGSNLCLLHLLASAGGFFTTSAPGKPRNQVFPAAKVSFLSGSLWLGLEKTLPRLPSLWGHGQVHLVIVLKPLWSTGPEVGKIWT